MKKFNEHTGCKITLRVDGNETVWKTDQWDCDVTQLISAFAGLMIGQSFLPVTVWSNMKEEAEDQMRFLKTDELVEKIENLERDKEDLEETVKKLQDQLQEVIFQNQEKVIEVDPGLLDPKENWEDTEVNKEPEPMLKICEKSVSEEELKEPLEFFLEDTDL